MYKPTLYLTMEADASRANEKGRGLASRLWSFTAPVTLVASPTDELSLRVRMKCSGRPYWDSSDEAQVSNWKNIARPFLRNKLASIVDVLDGLNVKRYNHYEGSLHFVWLKLQLAPYEIHVRLDSDAKDNDYIPDLLGLVDTVRDLVNDETFKSFADPNEAVTVYMPSRAQAETLRRTRADEASAYAAWQSSSDDGNAEHEDAPNHENETEEPLRDDARASAPHEEPPLAPGLVIDTAEFVKADGAALIRHLDSESWE